uniref:Uncharacterized protein n=2 Tax=gambiae species complex TaxID=44542 RepID=A0A182IF15_ANOAR
MGLESVLSIGNVNVRPSTGFVQLCIRTNCPDGKEPSQH